MFETLSPAISVMASMGAVRASASHSRTAVIVLEFCRITRSNRMRWTLKKLSVPCPAHSLNRARAEAGGNQVAAGSDLLWLPYYSFLLHCSI